jgi:thioredoxin 1
MIDIKSDEEFYNLIKNCNNKGIVVDFYATWCGPCKRIASKYVEISEKYNDIIFCKINVDDNRELIDKYQVGPIPHIIYIKAGNLDDHKIINVSKENGKELNELDGYLKFICKDIKIIDDF